MPTKGAHGEPWKFGKTGPEQMMLLNKHGQYVASVQIHQTPRHCGEIDEKRRAEAAKRIKACVNALDGLNPDALAGLIEAAESLLITMFAHQRHLETKVFADEYYNLQSALAKLKG